MNFKIFNELYEDETNSKASWLPENDFLLTEGIMKAKGLFSMRLNSGNHSEYMTPQNIYGLRFMDCRINLETSRRSKS